MSFIDVYFGGRESVHTTVLIPKALRDAAKLNGISMSATLRKALSEQLERYGWQIYSPASNSAVSSTEVTE